MRLGGLVRDHRSAIVARWERAIRESEGHQAHLELPRPALRDDMPKILDALAGWLEAGGPGEFEHTVTEHELARLEQGVPLHALVDEYAVLRRSLVETLQDTGELIDVEELGRMHRAVDDAISHAVLRYTKLRDERAAVRSAELQVILDRVPDAIYVGNAEGIFLANQRALDMLGFESIEALNQNIGELSARLHNRNLETGERLRVEEEGFVRALGGETSVTRVICRHLTTGKDVVVRCAAAPIVVDGSILGAVAINSDISDRIAAERERELFLGTLGHDLRGPLQSISMGLDLLQETSDEQSLAPLQRMKRSLQRMSTLITQIMEFARSRAGKMTLDVQPMELCTLIQELVAELSISHPDREFQCDLDRPVQGQWDRDRLSQVIHNLVNNALAHGSKDEPVKIACSSKVDEICLVVHNHGPPIPEEIRASLFEPFRRGAFGTGLGLGLYISCEIVRAHGGTIDVESTSETGTKFAVKLPRVARPATRDSRPEPR